MKLARVTAGAVLALRISYGLALIVAPRRLALRWLGPAAEDAPVQVALRPSAPGRRSSTPGALAAAIHGKPLRPWLAASAAGDVTDVIATAIGRRRLPRGSTPATLVVGGGAALASVALAAAVDA